MVSVATDVYYGNKSMLTLTNNKPFIIGNVLKNTFKVF